MAVESPIETANQALFNAGYRLEHTGQGAGVKQANYRHTPCGQDTNSPIEHDGLCPKQPGRLNSTGIGAISALMGR